MTYVLKYALHSIRHTCPLSGKNVEQTPGEVFAVSESVVGELDAASAIREPTELELLLAKPTIEALQGTAEANAEQAAVDAAAAEADAAAADAPKAGAKAAPAAAKSTVADPAAAPKGDAGDLVG